MAQATGGKSLTIKGPRKDDLQAVKDIDEVIRGFARGKLIHMETT